tara:strand:+ start:2269 stop:2805 length:537 start_codon:yes stop_codon:yes gene_type:complete
MKLTKSRLKQLIREQLYLMGGLEPENNFLRKHGIVLSDEPADENSTFDAFRSGAEVREAVPEDFEDLTETKKKRKLTKIQIIRRDKRAKEIILEALGDKKCIQVCYQPIPGFTPAMAAAAAIDGITKATHRHKVRKTAARPIEWGKGEGQAPTREVREENLNRNIATNQIKKKKRKKS